MGERGRMSVAAAGRLRKEYGYKAVIIVGVRDDGVVDVMSHGETKADCQVIGDYAQKQFGKHLPLVPFQTWFGWGNAGTPRRLSDDDHLRLLPKVSYVDANTHPAAEPA